MTTTPPYHQLPLPPSHSSAPITQIITAPPQPFYSLPTFNGQGSITDFFDQFESRLNYIGSPLNQRIIHLENHLTDTAAKYLRYLIRNHSREWPWAHFVHTLKTKFSASQRPSDAFARMTSRVLQPGEDFTTYFTDKLNLIIDFNPKAPLKEQADYIFDGLPQDLHDSLCFTDRSTPDQLHANATTILSRRRASYNPLSPTTTSSTPVSDAAAAIAQAFAALNLHTSKTVSFQRDITDTLNEHGNPPLRPALERRSYRDLTPRGRSPGRDSDRDASYEQRRSRRDLTPRGRSPGHDSDRDVSYERRRDESYRRRRDESYRRRRDASLERERQRDQVPTGRPRTQSRDRAPSRPPPSYGIDHNRQSYPSQPPVRSRHWRDNPQPSRSNSNRPFCEYCNRFGHYIQTCWQKNGQPKNE